MLLHTGGGDASPGNESWNLMPSPTAGHLRGAVMPANSRLLGELIFSGCEKPDIHNGDVTSTATLRL